MRPLIRWRGSNPDLLPRSASGPVGSRRISVGLFVVTGMAHQRVTELHCNACRGLTHSTWQAYRLVLPTLFVTYSRVYAHAHWAYRPTFPVFILGEPLGAH